MFSHKPILEAMRAASILGLMIALPLVLFTALGAWADKSLHTFPLFFFGGVILGGIASTINVYKLILPFLARRAKKNKEL